MNDIIKEASSILGKQLSRGGIRFRCCCAEDLTVYGRQTELVQVLLNIIINSCQAMGDEGGMLRICANQEGGTGCVNISVTDSGPGIAAGDIRRIFEPFFSTKQLADDGGQSGTGLGLAVCRDIITAHGGFIEVQSAEGQGATFTIFLPAGPS